MAFLISDFTFVDLIRMRKKENGVMIMNCSLTLRHFVSNNAAWAAASRAIGTRGPEQET